jgi:hypothetical protein
MPPLLCASRSSRHTAASCKIKHLLVTGFCTNHLICLIYLSHFPGSHRDQSRKSNCYSAPSILRLTALPLYSFATYSMALARQSVSTRTRCRSLTFSVRIGGALLSDVRCVTYVYTGLSGYREPLAWPFAVHPYHHVAFFSEDLMETYDVIDIWRFDRPELVMLCMPFHAVVRIFRDSIKYPTISGTITNLRINKGNTEAQSVVC